MSLPMPSGSCWTKRTTESNRTAPEILRGFFAPYPPADASCRTSGHTPPNPLTFPSHRHRPARPSRPARYPRRSPTPPFPHISPAPLTHIKIPEADRLRDFWLYQAQCDSQYSGGSDERSRGKGLLRRPRLASSPRAAHPGLRRQRGQHRRRRIPHRSRAPHPPPGSARPDRA